MRVNDRRFSIFFDVLARVFPLRRIDTTIRTLCNVGSAKSNCSLFSSQSVQDGFCAAIAEGDRTDRRSARATLSSRVTVRSSLTVQVTPARQPARIQVFIRRGTFPSLGLEED